MMADDRVWRLLAGERSSDDIRTEVERRRLMQHKMQMANVLALMKAMAGGGDGDTVTGADSSTDSDSDEDDSIVYSRESKGYIKDVSICGVNYKLLRLLGRGGFSKVYECLDPKNKRRAVKCVDYDGTRSEILESYEMEVKLLMGLDNCQRVIHVFGAEHVVEDKMLYAVMERGEIDLEELLHKGGVDKLKRKFYWKEMLLAVEQLHKKGIVHADLKPANFVLVEGTLKIIDLGLARMIKRDSTSVTCDSMAGTVDYISPEAFLERAENDKIKIGTFSDVWSLGVILYALLYGVTPFEYLPIIMLKLRAIANPNHEIQYKPVTLDDLIVLDCVKRCLQRDFNKRATIPELLNHQYLSATGSIKLTEDLIHLARK